MPVTNWKQSQVQANVDRGGGIDWSNPANASGSDNLYASTAGLSGVQTTDWLRLTGYGFTDSDIPSGSDIDGIEIEIERAASGFSIFDLEFFLRKSSGQVGNNFADTVTEWPVNDTLKTYGGATDTLGASWTAAEIKSIDFGIDISAKSNGAFGSAPRIDNVRIRVYYHEATAQGAATLTATATLTAAAVVKGKVFASALLQATASIQAVARKLHAGPTTIRVIGLGATPFAPAFDAIVRQEDSGALLRGVDPVVQQPTGGYGRLVRSEHQALTIPLYVELVTGSFNDLVEMARPGMTTTLLVDVDGERRTLRVMVASLHPYAESPRYAVLVLQTGDPRWESESAASVSRQFPDAPLAVQQDGSAIEDRAIITVRPDALKAQADSYRYYREVLFINRSGGAFPASWAHCITWNTAAEVTAGRMLASGNDVRILLDGVEVPRWADIWNNAASHIWFRSGLASAKSAKLRANITVVSPADDEALEVAPGGTTGWPQSGAIVFEDSLGTLSEVITYDGIGESPDGIEAFLNIKRAQRGTTAAAHTTAATLWWQEHRVQVLYGWSGAPAPDPHAELKPVNDLTSPDSLIWDSFLDLEEPSRAMQWELTLRQKGTRYHQMLVDLSAPGLQPSLKWQHSDTGPRPGLPNWNAAAFTFPSGIDSAQLNFTSITPLGAIVVYGYDSEGNEVEAVRHFGLSDSTVNLIADIGRPMHALLVESRYALVYGTNRPYLTNASVAPGATLDQPFTLPASISDPPTIGVAGILIAGGTGPIQVSLHADNNGTINPNQIMFQIVSSGGNAFLWFDLAFAGNRLRGGQKLWLRVKNNGPDNLFWTKSDNELEGVSPVQTFWIGSLELESDGGVELTLPTYGQATLDSVEATLSPTVVPLLALQQQQDAYWLNGTLTVGGSSAELAILAHVGDPIEIDMVQHQVRNVTTGERLVEGALFSSPTAWLTLPPGVTQVSYTEPGLVAATVTVQYHHRWEVLA